MLFGEYKCTVCCNLIGPVRAAQLLLTEVLNHRSCDIHEGQQGHHRKTPSKVIGGDSEHFVFDRLSEVTQLFQSSSVARIGCYLLTDRYLQVYLFYKYGKRKRSPY